MSFVPRSILVVDDDDVLRPRLVRALRDRGLEAVGAEGCAAARACTAERAFDLAVVDLRMGDGSGLDLVRDILSDAPETRVVVLTGYGSIATAVEAMRRGATSYVPKPADADEILRALDAPNDGAEPTAAEDEPDAPSLARAEWEHLNRVLTDCGGNISEAARRLGIHRRSLQRKLQKYPPPK